MLAILIWLAIGLPVVGGLVVAFVGDSREKLQHVVAVGFSAAAAVAALAILPQAGADAAVSVSFGPMFGDLTFVPDGLGAFLAAVATVVGCLAVVFSVDYMAGEAELGRYYSLVLYFIGAMAALALTSNLFFLFLFWEITALCSYALISFYNDDPKAVAGGIKALIITQFGGIGLLALALAAYAQTGSFEISTFLAAVPSIPAGVLSVMAYGALLAAAAKSAQFPFHTWLPDAMEAPTPVSALIHAATMVNAGIYLLARLYPAFADVPGWRTAVVLVGVISALIAALMAVVATDLKRLLAYSTVSQLGYMVYAVGAGGVFASQFHLLSHAVFKALLFLAAGSIIHSLGTRDMRKMGGVGRQMPFVRNVFIIGAIALIGLPPLNGFWSKELILEEGLLHGPGWAYALMLAGVALTALYTLRGVSMVFFSEDAGLHGHDAGRAMKTSLGILAAGTFVTWLFAGSFSRMMAETLPLHGLHELTIAQLAAKIFGAPATYLALGAALIGLAAWQWRRRIPGAQQSPGWLLAATESSFGLETANRLIVTAVQKAGAFLQRTQTGQLNWNVAGIAFGLIAVLIILAWSV